MDKDNTQYIVRTLPSAELFKYNRLDMLFFFPFISTPLCTGRCPKSSNRLLRDSGCVSLPESCYTQIKLIVCFSASVFPVKCSLYRQTYTKKDRFFFQYVLSFSTLLPAFFFQKQIKSVVLSMDLSGIFQKRPVQFGFSEIVNSGNNR